jgi:hypothetical protein
MAAAPIEQKAVAGPSAGFVIGYLCTILIAAVPWLNKHLTADQQQQLPIVLGFLFAAVAAYLAPHTHRPDLLEPDTGQHARPVQNVPLAPDQPHV